MSNSTTTRQIGARLRQARLSNKLTQNQVALQFKLSRQSVANWETGATAISAAQLGSLAAIYGASADFLIFGLSTIPIDNQEACSSCVQAQGIMGLLLKKQVAE